MGLSHLVAKTPNVVITAHTPKFEHIVKNILGPIHPTDLAAILVNMATWRANFFDAWDDSAPSRSMIISANSESGNCRGGRVWDARRCPS